MCTSRPERHAASGGRVGRQLILGHAAAAPVAVAVAVPALFPQCLGALYTPPRNQAKPCLAVEAGGRRCTRHAVRLALHCTTAQETCIEWLGADGVMITPAQCCSMHPFLYLCASRCILHEEEGTALVTLGRAAATDGAAFHPAGVGVASWIRGPQATSQQHGGRESTAQLTGRERSPCCLLSGGSPPCKRHTRRPCHMPCSWRACNLCNALGCQCREGGWGRLLTSSGSTAGGLWNSHRTEGQHTAARRAPRVHRKGQNVGLSIYHVSPTCLDSTPLAVCLPLTGTQCPLESKPIPGLHDSHFR